jgi:hypothetical protein
MRCADISRERPPAVPEPREDTWEGLDNCPSYVSLDVLENMRRHRAPVLELKFLGQVNTTDRHSAPDGQIADQVENVSLS